MAVDTVEVSRVFASMMADIKIILDAEVDSKRISSDLYAKGLLSTMQPTMQLATTQVQQQPLIDAQVDKTIADEAFSLNQSEQLTNSVTFNNKIKALDSYSDMIGTMGAGTLLITTDMWTSYFNMVGDLNSAMGANPSNTTVVKA